MSGFWAERPRYEPVGPWTPEEKSAFADALLDNTETRTHAEFMYQLTGWRIEEVDQVLCLRRLVQVGILDPQED